MMFDSTSNNIENDRIIKLELTSGGSPLTYAQVLELWGQDAAFRSYFTNLLAASPFAGFRWETPMLTQRTATRPFEFVLINTPGFCSRQTDANAYDSYFTDDDTDCGIVTFANLQGDATLVVPSPRTDDDAYGHLAAFIRRAPQAQHDAFWRIIGTTVRRQLSDVPIWLSTAGGGVAWLHVRLDSRPKYYAYAPYRDTN